MDNQNVKITFKCEVDKDFFESYIIIFDGVKAKKEDFNKLESYFECNPGVHNIVIEEVLWYKTILWWLFIIVNFIAFLFPYDVDDNFFMGYKKYTRYTTKLLIQNNSIVTYTLEKNMLQLIPDQNSSIIESVEKKEVSEKKYKFRMYFSVLFPWGIIYSIVMFALTSGYITTVANGNQISLMLLTLIFLINIATIMIIRRLNKEVNK